MNQPEYLLAPLSAQLEKNPSLRWLLAAAALLLALMLLQALSAYQARLRADAGAAQARLEQMQAIGEDKAWPRRAQEAQTAYAALLAEIPTTTTPGLAQASLQDWLQTTARGLPQLRNLSINLQPVAIVDEALGIVRVRATINAAASPSQVLQFVRRIESHPNLMTVETAQIHNTQNKTLTVTIASYYRILPSGEG